MATSDKRLVEMIKEFEADHQTWPALKAALFAHGNKPILLPKEMHDRMKAATRTGRQHDDLFTQRAPGGVDVLGRDGEKESQRHPGVAARAR